MKIKKVLIVKLIVIQFFIGQFSFSQNIKTYNGPYNGSNYYGYDAFSEEGVATYQYYENEKYERIYNGNFNYKYIYKNKTESNIIGKFKNGLKNGLWEYKFGNRCNIKGEFVDGLMNGIWTYKVINERTNKTLEESTVNFKEGILIGKYEYKGEFNVTGNFDNLGNRIGEWIITYKDDNGVSKEMIEIKRKYEDDAVTWSLKRNLANGKILIDDSKEQYNSEDKFCAPNVLFFWYLNLTESGLNRDLLSNPVFNRIIEGSTFISYDESKKIIANNMSYKNQITNAEVDYNNKKYAEAISEYESALQIKDSELIKDKLKKVKELKEEQDYQELIEKGDADYNNNNYSSALKFYNIASNYKKEEQQLKEKIKKTQDKFDEIERVKNENETKRNNFITMADDLLLQGKYKEANVNYKNALKIKNDDYCQKQIEISESLFLIDSLMQSKNYDLAVQKSNGYYYEFNSSVFSNKRNEVYDKCYKIYFQQAESLIKEKKYYEGARALAKAKQYDSKIRFETSNIDKDINEKQEQIISNMKSSTEDQKIIYESYFEIYCAILQEKDNAKYNSYLTLLSSMQDKMINNIAGNKKKAVRELSKAETYQEKAKIIYKLDTY